MDPWPSSLHACRRPPRASSSSPLNTSRWDVHLALHVLVVSSKVPPTRWPCLLMAFHPVTDRSSACLTDAKRSRQFVRGWMHIPNPALATCMVGETRQRPFPPLPHPPESLTDTAQSNIRKARNCIRQRLGRLPSLALVQRLSYRSSRGTHREIRCHRPKGGKQDVKKHRLWITQDLHRGLGLRAAEVKEVRTMREARRRSLLGKSPGAAVRTAPTATIVGLFVTCTT